MKAMLQTGCCLTCNQESGLLTLEQAIHTVAERHSLLTVVGLLVLALQRAERPALSGLYGGGSNNGALAGARILDPPRDPCGASQAKLGAVVAR